MRAVLRLLAAVLALVALCGGANPASAADGVVAREFVVEPATLIALGFEWYIDGDDNRNASVQVSYRKRGDTPWRPALPLLRLQGETVSIQGLETAYHAPNAFAGSILDLEPDQEYEARFVLSDPDGVQGDQEQRTVVRTRAEPMPASGGAVYHAYPDGWQGAKQTPAFVGLKQAYFRSTTIAADHYNVAPARVKPGDIILMHAGLYKDQRFDYGHEVRPGTSCCGTTWDGTYYLTASGTAERPIVIKAAGDGEVIFDGDGNQTLFDVTAGNYTYFEGITFRNTQLAIQAGHKDIIGASGITVKRSRFENVGIGIHTDWSGSKNFYIADNVFIGKHNAEVLVPFSLRPPFNKHPEIALLPGVTDELTLALSQYAVKVYGSGHVVAFNSVRNFHDGIDHHVYGLPDGYPNTPRDRMPVANDIYNNDISNMHDDCIESDGIVFNARILRNRCINAAGSGVSLQPIFAGPAYFIGNIVHHVPGNFAALKFAGSAGAVVYHNTFDVALRTMVPTSNAHFLNNLILAEFPDEPAFALATNTQYSSSDYNGFMPGDQAPAAFSWSAPAAGVSADYLGKPVERRFGTLAEYRQATGQDMHSILVTRDIFRNVPAAEVTALTRVYDPDSFDFRLKPGSKAVDAGVLLPNVNDNFKGRAPDLGALEVGAVAPHYGPRPPH